MLLQFAVEAVLDIAHHVFRRVCRGPAKKARTASKYPLLPLFDKADLGHVIKPFDRKRNTGPIFAVRHVTLKNAEAPSRHWDFEPVGFDEAGVFIARGDRSVLHRLKGGIPGVVVAADGKLLLHAIHGGTSRQE